MIGFGELRKRSLEWHTDIAIVERAYATDWLLKGLAQAASDSLILRGGSALRYAYSSSYPVAEMPELLAPEPLDEAVLHQVLTEAVHVAAETSGLGFALDSLARGSAKVKFTGPLGRRSAAQPHIALALIPGKPRLASVQRPLIHPFSDQCAAILSVIAMEELIGERMALLAAQPRARDVFDLWFAATQLPGLIDWARARALASELAAKKSVALPRLGELFEPTHRARLEATWDSALRNLPGHPTFAQIEKDLQLIYHG